MAQLPTPPVSRSGSEVPEKSEISKLAQCLDELLERYLGLLDQQQKLQSSLAEQLSSGFFALAQANFSCPPGRRYGRDYYDERMKATRKIMIKPEQYTGSPMKGLEDSEGITHVPNSKFTFSVERASRKVSEQDGKDKKETIDLNRSSPVQDTQPEASESTLTEATSAEPSDSSDTPTPTLVETPQAERKRFCSTDPLHWYGILVPQSLRRAQTSFTTAIDQQVPDLASTILEMRTLEHQIRALQAQLGSEVS